MVKHTQDLWARTVKANATTLAIPVAPFEKLGVAFWVEKLEVGHTFILPNEFASLARESVIARSSMGIPGIEGAFFSPHRPLKLVAQDVVFSVVDAKPQNKKHFHATAKVPVVGEIVVRAYAPHADGQGDQVTSAWRLERWNVRGWCSTDEIFQRVSCSLLHVSEAAEVPALTVCPGRRGSRGGVPEEAAAPLQLASTRAAIDVDAAILALLAENMDDGATFFDMSQAGSCEEVVSHEDLVRLQAVGAITAYENDFGETAYVIKPAGVRHLLRLKVLSTEWAAVTSRSVPSSRLSKLELLFLLFQDGYRPLTYVDNALTRAGDKFVAMSGLLRSKPYLRCILDADRVWERGTEQIVHDGAHHYYECLLQFDTPEQHMEVARLGPNPSIIADEEFKKLLQRVLGHEVRLALVPGGDVEHAVVDGDVVEGGGLGAAPVLPPLVGGIADWMQPQSFPIVIDASTDPPVRITVHLDGFSHQSGRRRCYAQCCQHVSCHKYVFLSSFGEPWEAFAFITLWMRRGYHLADKTAHYRMEPPLGSDLASVYDEVPAFFLAGHPTFLG